MTDAPLRLVLTAQEPRGGSVPQLLDWIRRDPAYRGAVSSRPSPSGGSGLGDAAIVAIVAQGALLGLFRLLKAWVEAHRANATIRVRVNGADAYESAKFGQCGRELMYSRAVWDEANHFRRRIDR